MREREGGRMKVERKGGREEGGKEGKIEGRKKWREGGKEEMKALEVGAEGNTEQKQIHPGKVLGLANNTTTEEKQNDLLRRKGKS